MKNVLGLIFLFSVASLTAQTVEIINNYPSRVRVVVSGSKLIGTGQNEQLAPAIPKIISIGTKKTRRVHIDVISSITFTNLTNPSTKTKPYTINFMYLRYVGAYTAAKDREITYEITPEGTIRTPTKKK